MPRIVDVPVSDMLLDPENARLGEVQDSQQSTALALARQQGKKLIKLATSIQERGLDPAQLPVVLSTGDRRRRYQVLEGNRRVLALKAMETPSLVQSALAPADFKKLVTLSTKFAASPIDEVSCVLFEQEEKAEAYTWVLLRHTSGQGGAGLDEWDSDEKDRFAARHGAGKSRGVQGQVLDFLSEVDGPSTSQVKIATNVGRILGSEYAREKLGLAKVGGELVSYYPTEEVAKGLRKIVDDLRSQTIKVPDIYTRDQQKAYLDKFARKHLPTKAKRLKEPIKLTELPSGKGKPVKAQPKPKRTQKPKAPRTTVAEPTAKINPGPPRINQIYNELVALSADNYPNAGSVLLRVFIELSVDDYLTTNSIPPAANDVLAKRLKNAADHMLKNGKIDKDLKVAVAKIADSQHGFAAGVHTFHQYVHNKYVYPKPSELLVTWDQLQPFLEVIWP